MQSDPIAVKASELLRLGLMPSPEEIKDGKVSKDRVLVLVVSMLTRGVP